MPTKKRTRRVSLPKPRRTSSRAELVIVMHPTELDALIERARTRSMSLTRYVEALLASDPDDVAPAPVKTLSLAELAKGPDPRQLSLESAPRMPCLSGCMLPPGHVEPCRDDRGAQLWPRAPEPFGL